MDVKIQSVGFKTDGKLDEFIRNKIGKVLKHDEDILSVEVVLQLEKSEVLENKVIELNFDLKGGGLFVKKNGKSFEESMDMACEAMRRQVVKHKDKLRAK